MAVKHGGLNNNNVEQKNLSASGLTAQQKAERFGAISKEQGLSVSGLSEKEKLAAYGTKQKHMRSKSNAAGAGTLGSAHKQHDFGFGNHAQEKLYMGAGMHQGVHQGALGGPGMLEQFE